jgi:hypothetical protein
VKKMMVKHQFWEVPNKIRQTQMLHFRWPSYVLDPSQAEQTVTDMAESYTWIQPALSHTSRLAVNPCHAQVVLLPNHSLFGYGSNLLTPHNGIVRHMTLRTTNELWLHG